MYYNISSGEYDDMYCRVDAENCKKLDCHEPESEHFELVGVFKETDGLEDFAEQEVYLMVPYSALKPI